MLTSIISLDKTAGGRLAAALVPETCTDARGISTTYAYIDSLNRLTSKTYSDGTPKAQFFYDESSATLGSWTSPGLLNTKGRLTHTGTYTSTGGTATGTAQDYDKMGRVAGRKGCQVPFSERAP